MRCLRSSRGARLVPRGNDHRDVPTAHWCLAEGSGGAHRLYNVASKMRLATDGIAGHWLTQELTGPRQFLSAPVEPQSSARRR
jgi:hypothetical protein